MGLNKVETELEYFPGVMRPEKHVVSGWSAKQATKKKIGSESLVGNLLFVASSELTIVDVTLINEMLDTQCELLFEFPAGYVYSANDVEISQREAIFLDDYVHRLRWFDWRLFDGKQTETQP